MLWHLPIVAGAVLLAAPVAKRSWLAARFVPDAPTVRALATLLVVLGPGLALWARSSPVPSAPSAIQIYAGMLLALLGTTLFVGKWRGLLGFGLMTPGFLAASGWRSSG